MLEVALEVVLQNVLFVDLHNIPEFIRLKLSFQIFNISYPNEEANVRTFIGKCVNLP